MLTSPAKCSQLKFLGLTRVVCDKRLQNLMVPSEVPMEVGMLLRFPKRSSSYLHLVDRGKPIVGGPATDEE